MSTASVSSYSSSGSVASSRSRSASGSGSGSLWSSTKSASASSTASSTAGSTSPIVPEAAPLNPYFNHLPWYPRKKQPIISRPTLPLNCMGRYHNNALAYYFQCLVKSNNANTAAELAHKGIAHAIYQSTAAFLPNPGQRSTLSRLIRAFTCNFRDQYIAWDGAKSIMMYASNRRFTWKKLKCPGSVVKVQLTKHTASILLSSGPAIRIFPERVFKDPKKHKQHDRIHKQVRIDWTVHGLVEEYFLNTHERVHRHDKAVFERLCTEKHTVLAAKSKIRGTPKKVRGVLVTHVLCHDHGVILLANNATCGYVEAVRMKQYGGDKPPKITLEKCECRLLDRGSCCGTVKKTVKRAAVKQGRTRIIPETKMKTCGVPPDEYCWNGCCKQHCINTSRQCLYHKEHHRSIDNIEEFRLKLCHRWD